MRIPIDDNKATNDSVYPSADAQSPSQAAPGWLDAIHVEQQVPQMSEEEAFFTDADPFETPQTNMRAMPAQNVEQPQPQPDLSDDEFPELDEMDTETSSSAQPEFVAQPMSDSVSHESAEEPSCDTHSDEDVAQSVSESNFEQTVATPAESQAPSVEEDAAPQGDDADMVSREEYETLQHRYDRLLADWENYKRRTARELAEAKENANQNLLKAMMPAFDDFARVVFHSTTSDNPEVAEVVAGVEAIHRKLFNALAREGVIEIAPTPGEPFDMNRHQAIERCPSDEEHPVDCVMKLYQVGYEMNGKILRPAMVAVTV